jgi:replicative DNA helicase
MRNLEASGSAIDVITVSDQLERDGHIATSPTLLADCFLNCPSPDNVEHYASILRRHRIARDVVKIIGDVTVKITAGQMDGPDALLAVQSGLGKIESGERDDRGKTIGLIVREICTDIERGEVPPSGISSGLKRLDAKTGGIPYGVPTLVLAPPGSGKSTIALTFFDGAESEGDAPVLYSYEDGHKSFGQRAIARQSGVPTELIRSGGEFKRHHMEAFNRQMPKLVARRAVVVRASGMSVEELTRDVRSRRLKHKGPGTTARLVIVDYIHRMPLPSMHGGSKNDRIGEISKRLADLAANEHIAVVICSQVNRLAPREARPPNMQDARDCGELEADAKLMLGLFRPGFYGKPPSSDDKSKTAASASLLEIHILKNHQGEANCHLEVHWDLETHAIVDEPSDLARRIA